MPVLCEDNGQGIEPRFHETVFGLFNKLDARSEGTGVGLALVHRIINVHNGKIWVESEGEGMGSTFCFTLPVPSQIRPTRRGKMNGEPVLVLLIEDNPDHAELIIRTMSEHRIANKIFHVSDGQQALEYLFRQGT